MLRNILLAVAASFFAATAGAATCPPHKLTPPDQVKIDNKRVMVVVHASSSFDSRFSTKRGIDEAVRFAKGQMIPVIYLQDDSPEQFYFMEDCNPDYWVASQGGEITFDLGSATQIYIVGGHLELCLLTASNELIYQWAQKKAQNLKVTYFMDAIYSNGKLIDPGDPFYHDFDRFLNIVAYGRPGGEHWPKLTLLETIGIIRNEAHELDYIKQILPRWDTTFPESYRVETRMNGSPSKVLRAADGWSPPMLQFHFIDSAINLLFPDCNSGIGAGLCSE